MLARFLFLTFATFACFAKASPVDQTTLFPHEKEYRFEVVHHAKVRGGAERISPILPTGAWAREPYVYRTTTWSKFLTNEQKKAVTDMAPFPWRESADTTNSYMEVMVPENARWYFAFSTDWHILSGYLSNSTASEFVTVISPVTLDNGFLDGLSECLEADDSE